MTVKDFGLKKLGGMGLLSTDVDGENWGNKRSWGSIRSSVLEYVV